MIDEHFNIASSIQMIRLSQVKMMRAIADFSEALHNDSTNSQKIECLADLEIAMYLVSLQLGFDKEELDKKAKDKLRIELLKEEGIKKEYLKDLYRQLNL